MEKLGFLAFLAPIIAFWGQIQNFIKQIFFIVIRKDTIEYQIVSQELLLHFYQNGKAFYFGPRTWAMFVYRYLEKYKIHEYTIAKAEPYKFFLYKNWVPVLIIPSSDIAISVYYVFGTVNLKKVLDEVVRNIYKETDDKNKKSLKKREYKGRGYEYNVLRTKKNSLNTKDTSLPSASGSLGLPSRDQNTSPSSNNVLFQFYSKLHNYYSFLGLENNEVKSSESEKNKAFQTFFWSKEGLYILNIVKYWLGNSDWFFNRGLQHRHGILLYGKPGTGKSALIKQIAQNRDMAITAIELAGMTAEEFSDYVTGHIPPRSIVLIEDIDCIFDGRKNISSNNNYKDLLSFDTFINILSGVQAKNSVLWFITTNNIDKIDPALLRPGRLDEKIEIGMLPKEGKEIIAKNILRDWPDLVESLVNEGKEYTAAEFEHKCIEIATEKFWKERKAETNE